MLVSNKKIILRFLRFAPIFLLFYLSLSETDTYFKSFDFLSFNLPYILIFYWVIRSPQLLGYGFIFLAGVINDVVLGLPIGITSLTYLIISGVAAYIKNVTVARTLISDWIIFVPTVLATNCIYILVLLFFSDLTINYEKLLYNSFITIIFYPIGWFVFELFNNIIKIER